MCYSSFVTRLIMIKLNILMLIIPGEIPATTQLGQTSQIYTTNLTDN